MKLIIRPIVIYALFFLCATNSYASTFGDSCSALPLFDSSGYLTENTAYGYIRENIDMKNHVQNACDSNNDEFRFCIKNAPKEPKICTSKVMKIGESAKLSELSLNPDIGGQPALANIVLSVEILKSEVCLMIPTSRGMMPLLCRNKEAAVTEKVPSEPSQDVCKIAADSCYKGDNKSQSLLNFSGLTIDCLRSTLDKVFYVGSECPALNEDITFSLLRPFPVFQDAMKNAVRAALIIYVIFFGFKIVLNNEYAQLNKIALFIIKFILVVYFAIGLGNKTLQDGSEVKHNGMTEFALPILLNLTSNFADIAFSAGGSQGLCDFDVSKYDKGFEFYKIWDAVDCRIAYYLGMKVMYNNGSILNSLSSSVKEIKGSDANFRNVGDKDDALNVLKEAGVLAFFPVMFGFFTAGKIIILILNFVFLIVLISILLYFLMVYLVCTITLYVMAYISPIFIPMVLFDRTKAYFDSWLRIVISATLQPAIIGAVIAFLLTMFDSAIYENCEFQRHDYATGENKFSTFELRLPDSEPEKCKSSYGYKIMSHYLSNGWESKIGLLFTTPKVNDHSNILPSLIYTTIYILIFYFFVQTVGQFASDITGGPNVSSVTVSPTMIMDKIGAAASAIASAAKSGRGEKVGGGGGGGAQDGGGDAKSGDSVSTSSRPEAKDRVSAGSGGQGGQGDAK